MDDDDLNDDNRWKSFWEDNKMFTLSQSEDILEGVGGETTVGGDSKHRR
jgi:hypothetical protein